MDVEQGLAWAWLVLRRLPRGQERHGGTLHLAPVFTYVTAYIALKDTKHGS